MQRDIYTRLRQQIGEIPVIDCHEHAEGPAKAADCREPIALLITGYLASNLPTVPLPGSADARPDLRVFLEDGERSTEEKWPLFAPVWRGIEHTAYARVTRLIMRDNYGETDTACSAA
jgi:hypothetical protein